MAPTPSFLSDARGGEIDLPREPDLPHTFVRDITQHGASTDGPCTAAIAGAIRACAEAGGGRVVVPPGEWDTGPIHLSSRIELRLEKGATLRFSQDPADYLPVVYQQRGGVLCMNYSPLVYAHRCDNIAITGEGVLDGQGEAWWSWKHRQPGMKRLFEMGRDGVPVEQRVFGTVEDGVRPPFIQFIDCRRVLLEGVTVRNGPSWQVHPVGCDDLTVRRVSVTAPEDAHNTDGIDPDSCRRVLIEDCSVDTGDDAICLKAGRDRDAWDHARPCEHVIVRRCSVRRGHGGFVIGSEMSADVRHVLAEDCDFDGTDCGIRLKSNRGRGGVVEDVLIRNIIMRNIRHDAIRIDLEYSCAELYGEALPTFRDIRIASCRRESAKRSLLLRGLPESPLQGIALDDLSLEAAAGPNILHVRGLDVGSAL